MGLCLFELGNACNDNKKVSKRSAVNALGLLAAVVRSELAPNREAVGESSVWF
jgi:hypothetical protein